MTEPLPQTHETRFGFVAVIGAPNVGKSTLVNTIVGAKVAIVSRKVQTTRIPVCGIAISGKSQLVFVDTPGIFQPRRRLDRAMVNAAWGRAGEADVVVVLIDAAKGIDEEAELIVANLENVAAPRVLALNKVDRVKQKENLLAVAAAAGERIAPEAVFMISALTGDGLPDLVAHLASAVPAGPWHFPEEDITDMPLRLLAAEITREQIYERMHEELPYAITVETTAWKELDDGSARIEQTIFVERESQKKIVIGKGGAAIRQISGGARAELSRILERPVHLFVFAKVRAGWGDDPERYRELGLEYPKD